MKNQVSKLPLFEIKTGEFLYYSPLEKQFYTAPIQQLNIEKWNKFSQSLDKMLLLLYPIFLYGAYRLNNDYQSFASIFTSILAVILSSTFCSIIFYIYTKRKLDSREEDILKHNNFKVVHFLPKEYEELIFTIRMKNRRIFILKIGTLLLTITMGLLFVFQINLIFLVLYTGFFYLTLLTFYIKTLRLDMENLVNNQ